MACCDGAKPRCGQCAQEYSRLHRKTEPKPFSLVEVSLVERAVYWHSDATASATHAELTRRCEATATSAVIHARLTAALSLLR